MTIPTAGENIGGGHLAVIPGEARTFRFQRESWGDGAWTVAGGKDFGRTVALTDDAGDKLLVLSAEDTADMHGDEWRLREDGVTRARGMVVEARPKPTTDEGTVAVTDSTEVTITVSVVGGGGGGASTAAGLSADPTSLGLASPAQQEPTFAAIAEMILDAYGVELDPAIAAAFASVVAVHVTAEPEQVQQALVNLAQLDALSLAGLMIELQQRLAGDAEIVASLAAVATSGEASDVVADPTSLGLASPAAQEDAFAHLVEAVLDTFNLEIDPAIVAGFAYFLGSQVTVEPTEVQQALANLAELGVVTLGAVMVEMQSRTAALTALTDSLSTVATSGAYADLSGAPSLATVATSGAYGDLSGRPTLATVATSGAYGDLSGRPTLATVATSGAYADLSGRPTTAPLPKPKMPTAVPMRGIPTSNATAALGRVYWVPVPVFGVNVKITHVWLDLVTAQANTAATIALVANDSSSDYPTTILATTAANAVDTTTGTGAKGAALSSAYTLTAGTQIWAALIVLATSGTPTAPTIRFVAGTGNATLIGLQGTAPVTPSPQSTMPSGWQISSLSAIPDPPAAANLAVSTISPSLWLSIEAP